MSDVFYRPFLSDFPTQTIHITSPDRIAKLQDKISECPDYLDELGKLKSSSGDIIFNKGKSCLFPLSFESAQSQLSEIPLFIVLTDEVGKQAKFLGSIGISLAKLMDSLRDKTAHDSTAICNEALRGSYPIKNLMGSRIAKLAVEVKLFYYGKNLVHHIPALNNVVAKVHESPLGKSEHLTSNDAIISVMEDIEQTPVLDALNETPEMYTPDPTDSDKDKDETDLNPPPLFYQATPRGDVLSRDTKLLHKNVSSQNRHMDISLSNEVSPKQQVHSKSNAGSRADESRKTVSPIQQVDIPSSDEILKNGYDPKKFDLIRAVLTELTYLTDFLDPKLGQPQGGPSNDSPKNVHEKPLSQFSSEKPGSVIKQQPTKTLGRYGLTNSYILRLCKLGPDKAMEVLSKHLDKQSVSSIMNRFFESPAKTVPKTPVKRSTKPVLVNSEVQTDTVPSPRVVWQDQSPDSSRRRGETPPDFVDPLERLSGTTPFTVAQEEPLIPLDNSNSSTMAQVLAAMQALANTGPSKDAEMGMSPNRDTRMSQEREAPSRLSRHSSLRRVNSNQDYVYSDNFEEQSCVSLNPLSPCGRPVSSRAPHSRLSMQDLVVEEEDEDFREHEVVENKKAQKHTPFRRSSRNTRYEARSNSLKTASTRDDHDSSSTTSTAASTTYVSPRRFRASSSSKKSQTSYRSRSTSAVLERPSSCSSARSTSIACQTPALSRTHSTQTELVSESDEGESVLTVLPSPTRDLPSPTPEVPSDHASPARDLASDHVISSHSSLESGSIYIGSDTDVDEEEEDPLQLSYLLSTESVQFSDEDQPTSLLKLCSPSEARAVNKFMYTF